MAARARLLNGALMSMAGASSVGAWASSNFAACDPCKNGSTAISSEAITASASRMAPAAAKPPVAAGPVRFSPKPPTAITAAASATSAKAPALGAITCAALWPLRPQ